MNAKINTQPFLLSLSAIHLPLAPRVRLPYKNYLINKNHKMSGIDDG
jgi:hypothetical protein